MDERLRELICDESRRGAPGDSAYTGAAGGSACGDLARVSVEVRDGAVAAVTVDSEGCGATHASVACVAEMAEGAGLLEAASIDPDAVAGELGGLTPGKMHAAILAVDALHRAVSAAISGGEAAGPPAEGERVLVALSGGVDSAVAAMLERDRGAEVVAVTLKLWSDPETDGTKACCSPEAVMGARGLSHRMGMPHLTLDLEGEFRERVVQPFLEGYAAGRTPNPCVLCNGDVRIAAMLDLADRVGAGRLVTGHYARVVDDGDGPLLAAAADPAKDQGYMLAGLPTRHLERISFPLGDMTKDEVRSLAAERGLPVSSKPESQDLCFLAGQGKREFLRRHAGLGERTGEIRDRSGRVLGSHGGHHHFTVGQRRGLGVASTEPLYVLEIDAERNLVVVGTREELLSQGVEIRDAVLHRDAGRVDAVKLRYRSEAVSARVPAEQWLPAGRYPSLELSLDSPFAGIAPGQAAVLMSGEEVVGHGTIESAAG